MKRLVLAAILACAGRAWAGGATVAVPPIASLTDGGAGAVEKLLVDAIGELPDHRAIGPDKVRELCRKAKRRDLEACDGAPACLAELGRLAGASVVIYGEAGSLAGDRVVYLKAIDAASASEKGSTAVVLEKSSAAAATRAAVVRLLTPERYTGTLWLTVDVRGASVFLDGRARGQSPIAPLELPVGTYALRVTHPSYRDFVRFVEVSFGQRTQVTAELQRYPIVGRSLRAGDSRGITDNPWVLAGAGVALAATVAIIVALIPHDVERDRDVTVHAP